MAAKCGHTEAVPGYRHTKKSITHCWAAQLGHTEVCINCLLPDHQYTISMAASSPATIMSHAGRQRNPLQTALLLGCRTRLHSGTYVISTRWLSACWQREKLTIIVVMTAIYGHTDVVVASCETNKSKIIAATMAIPT